MAKPSRKDVRMALIAGLKGSITGIDQAQIIGYKPPLKGEFPWIAVLSDGSGRPPMTQRGTESEFYINILTYVAESALNWTEEQAEQLLDDLEAQIAAYLETVKGNINNWNSLDYSERSRVSRFDPQGGTVYLIEAIPVKVTVLK